MELAGLVIYDLRKTLACRRESIVLVIRNPPGISAWPERAHSLIQKDSFSVSKSTPQSHLPSPDTLEGTFGFEVNVRYNTIFILLPLHSPQKVIGNQGKKWCNYEKNGNSWQVKLLLWCLKKNVINQDFPVAKLSCAGGWVTHGFSSDSNCRVCVPLPLRWCDFLIAWKGTN